MKQLLIILGILISTVSFSACKTSMKSSPIVNIIDQEWKLTELNGKAVTDSTKFRKHSSIKFLTEEKRVSGSGGCNAFSGTYELSEGNRIRLSGIISTRMACIGVEIEDLFFYALKKTDNYSISGKTLTFNDVNKIPLARFELVEKK